MTSSPIRCSWAADVGDTGLETGESDTSEGFNGNGFLAPLTVTAGQTYYLLIDNFSANSTPFSLNWGGSAVLNCAVLPVELMWFDVVKKSSEVQLKWATATENDNYGFHIEKSNAGQHYQRVAFIPGAGYSQELIEYSWTDQSLQLNASYSYRLAQEDFNGVIKYYYPDSNGQSGFDILRIEWHNVLGQIAEPQATGVLVKTTYFVNGEIQVEKICVNR